MLLARKRGLHILIFYMKMKLLQHCLSTFLVLEVQFFLRVCSFRGSVFSQVCTSGLPVNLEFILAQYTQLNDTTQNSNRHTNQLATALELHILPHYFN